MTNVLIVGAGPVGLCCAIDLLRRGISCRVIEQASAFAVGTRARGISARTQEIFESLGVLHTVQRFAEPILPTRFYGRDGELVRETQPGTPLPASPDVPYPNALMISQQNTDSALRARLAELGGEVEMNCTLDGLTQDDQAVIATVFRSGSTETVRADYLIGSDGGGSKARECAGLQLAGEAWEDANSYLIGNLSVDGVDREHWHIWTDPEWGYLTLQPVFHHRDTGHGGTWLFVATVPSGESADRAVPTAESMQRLFNQRLPSMAVSFKNLTWHSLYRRRLKIADRFRAGRVFLAGDSAHAGVEHGMNIGIQDALNLTWKLAHKLRGAPEQLLNTYEEERRPIASQILAATLGRDRVKSGASAAADLITDAVTNKTAATDATQLRVGYRNSSLSCNFADLSTIQAGDRAPDAAIASGTKQRLRLFELMDGRRFTLLHFTGALQAETFANGECLAVYQIRKAGSRADGDARTLIDTEGHAYHAYGIAHEALVLIRPDGYIGATGRIDQISGILQYASRNYAV